MKRNAIMRIIIWCLVLVILLGLLAAGMLYPVYRRLSTSVSAELIPDTNSTSTITPAVVLEETIVYVSPNPSSEQRNTLSAGVTVGIIRQENVDGTEWAYIETPTDGWIPMDRVTLDTGTLVETESNQTGYSVKADSVRNLEIDWVSGSIRVEPADVKTITFSESEPRDGRYQLRWELKEHTLKISFCDETLINWPGVNSFTGKDLTVLVPRDFALESLEVDSASATLEVKDLTIRDVEVDSASGACQFDGCTLEQLDVDTASGDIRFQGRLHVLDCEGASASIYAALDNVPSRISVDTMSGDLDLTLPENAGYTLKLDAMSSEFDSDFETTLKNGQYISGDGSCRIDVSAMSGDVTIRKAAAS